MYFINVFLVEVCVAQSTEIQIVNRSANTETAFDYIAIQPDGGSIILNPFLDEKWPMCVRFRQTSDAHDLFPKMPKEFRGDWTAMPPKEAWATGRVIRGGIFGKRFRANALSSMNSSEFKFTLRAELSKRGRMRSPYGPERIWQEQWEKIVALPEDEVFAKTPPVIIDSGKSASNLLVENIKSQGLIKHPIKPEVFQTPFQFYIPNPTQPVQIIVDGVKVDGQNCSLRVLFVNQSGSHVKNVDPFLENPLGTLITVYDVKGNYKGVFNLNGRFASNEPPEYTLPVDGIVGRHFHLTTGVLRTDTDYFIGYGGGVGSVKINDGDYYLQAISSPSTLTDGKFKEDGLLWRSNLVPIRFEKKL